MFSYPMGMRSILPIMRLIRPASPKIPNPGTLISTIRSPIPKRMRKTAPILISKPVPINPSTIEITPNTSAPTPGLEIPKISP